ncbi:MULTISPECIES: zinc ribbon domain-containing protein [unclassified Nonomuraea]|uniref:zinc ribbon domain-containing protein n=1 Tax=unclassified Nonomuraea TaxID=2593643 RepID=UPI0033D8993F
MGSHSGPAHLQGRRSRRPGGEGPAAGTSQTCHRCGHRDAAARVSQAVISCTSPACGWIGNADHNAAINIANAAGTAVSGRGDLRDTRSVKRQPPYAA